MRILILLAIFILLSSSLFSQENTVKLVRYEELTAVDFIQAVGQSESTCIIPFGVLEKHGAHLPLGTDILDARYISLRAAEREYTIIFPQYYFGQINEAKHQPGTIAYTHNTIWDLLEETCEELSRNGMKKIIIVNGHGGNNSFLEYFCQVQLEKKRDYAVYYFNPKTDVESKKIIKEMRKTNFGGHADEVETSMIMAHRPDLVQLDKAKTQNGENQKRLENVPDLYTGIHWYAKFPNHYAGDGSFGNKELGEIILNAQVEQLIGFIKKVKEDKNVIELQNRFYKESDDPLKTKQ